MSQPKQQPPTAAEHAKLRAWLQARGIASAQLDALVGPAPDGRSRAQLERALTGWLRTRPKGG